MNRLRHTLARDCQGCGGQLKSQTPLDVTSRFGVSSITHGAKDIAALINQVDKALYLAKQSGRNRVARWGQVKDEIAA